MKIIIYRLCLLWMGHPLTLSQLRMDQSVLTCTPPRSTKGTSTVTVQVSFGIFILFFSPQLVKLNHVNNIVWPAFLCPTREKRRVCVRGVSASRRVRVWRRGGVWGWRERLSQRRWHDGENLPLRHETELHLRSHRHDGEYGGLRVALAKSVSSFWMS